MYSYIIVKDSTSHFIRYSPQVTSIDLVGMDLHNVICTA